MNKKCLIYSLLILLSSNLIADERTQKYPDRWTLLNLSFLLTYDIELEPIPDANVYGLSLGFLTGVKKNVVGLDFSFVFNYVEETQVGFQLSSIINISKVVFGTQLSLTNIALYLYGFQVGLINGSEEVIGFQIGGINIGEKMSGIQIGGYNISEKYNGIQIAGPLNYSYIHNGLQMALFNFCTPRNENADFFTVFGSKLKSEQETFINGVQIGLFNFSEVVNGVQIGLFNRCFILNGVQIGLINYASENNIKMLPIINIGF